MSAGVCILTCVHVHKYKDAYINAVYFMFLDQDCYLNFAQMERFGLGTVFVYIKIAILILRRQSILVWPHRISMSFVV